MKTNRRILSWVALLACGALFGEVGAQRAAQAATTASAGALVQQAERELATHPGQAVLDYERAQLLAPRAPEVREGLARARAAAGLPAQSAGLASRIARTLSPDEWSRVALGALALAALAIVGRPWWRRWALPWAGAALSVALVAGAVAWQSAPRRNDAVVVGASPVARIAPFAAAQPAFVAPEGSAATIEAEHQGYTRIRQGRGVGWVPNSAVAPVIPRS